jgi:hypothetical protein
MDDTQGSVLLTLAEPLPRSGTVDTLEGVGCSERFYKPAIILGRRVPKYGTLESVGRDYAADFVERIGDDSALVAKRFSPVA